MKYHSYSLVHLGTSRHSPDASRYPLAGSATCSPAAGHSMDIVFYSSCKIIPDNEHASTVSPTKKSGLLSITNLLCDLGALREIFCPQARCLRYFFI